MLFRSIDLERTYRTISKIGSQMFILLQRKGVKHPQWEALMEMPQCPRICPKQLLLRYVALTHHQVSPGSPLFISLKPPFIPLKANSLGSLTRQALQQLGVNTAVWKPHSTKNAGVALFKRMGWSSEEVCEIGKWKNAAAFTSHYLRLDASKTAAEKLQEFLVHNVSPLESAEPDLTCTTGKNDPGGYVREGGAQDNGETRFSPGCLFIVLGFFLALSAGIAFLAGGWWTYDPVACAKLSLILQNKRKQAPEQQTKLKGAKKNN